MRSSRGPLLISLILAFAGCTPHEEPVVPAPIGSVAPSATAAASEPMPPEDPAPKGRLPADVRPARYALGLTLIPENKTFEGTVEIAIKLDQPRAVIWMHAKGLTAREVTVTPEGGAAIGAKLEQVNDDGVAALRPARVLPAGKATIRIVFEGPYLEQDQGLYVAKAGGQPYAFTQFEEISARQAFPCFDEPAFKTPYDLTITVKQDHKAIGNTREIKTEDAGSGMKRVHFATTEPIPSYLVAFAAGPFDVVEGPAVPPNAVRSRPVPLRGVAVKGRGKDLAYALAHTGEILGVLEQQIGLPYPYDKLDVLAVPDKGGAMENPGAVTFSEYLLLVDEATAPVSQRRAFAGVMAHELAHQWFGDEVTMVWWDDIWLNEAFATWMGGRATQAWRADTEAETHLLERVMGAMGSDSLVSARSIRQPIESSHDIRNAFDDITYQKGGGVIGMFERWMGRETFQKGIKSYLKGHHLGNATADDLMKSLSEASGKDVGTPFKTFLDQPGVPLVEVKAVCGDKPHLALTQSRYLPLGTKGDAAKTWQIPVCARYQAGKETKEACTLLTSKEGTLPLDACPDWVLPNADGAGYFRYQMAPHDLEAVLRKGFGKISVREKMSLAASLRAGFNRGTTPADEVMKSLAPFARDAHPLVANEPMGLVGTARDWLYGTPQQAKVEAYARSLYGARARAFSWDKPKSDADPEGAVLRQRILGFLANIGQDPAVRKEAAKRGRAYLGVGGDGKLHPEAVDPDLTSLSLAVAVEDGDAALFDLVLDRLAATEDDVLRGRLLGALGAARTPALAARARELALDPRLRVGETLSTLWPQLSDHRTRDAAWAWAKDHLDALIAKISPTRAAYLPYLAGSYCDEAHAKDVEDVFGPRREKLNGVPRNLAGATENIRLCAAKQAAQGPHMSAFFGGKKRLGVAPTRRKEKGDMGRAGW
jgi:alanyl aminopeptidase